MGTGANLSVLAARVQTRREKNELRQRCGEMFTVILHGLMKRVASRRVHTHYPVDYDPFIESQLASRN